MSKPGIKNLIDVQCALLNEAPSDLVARYAGKMYGHLKQDTADVVISCVGPVRDEAERLLTDRGELDRLLRMGADKARERASRTLEQVYDAVGFAPLS